MLFIQFYERRNKPKFNVKGILHELGFRWHGVSQFIFTTLILLAQLFFISLAISIISSLLGFNDLSIVGEKITELLKTPYILAYLFLVRIVSEEIFFRGFLVKRVGVYGSAFLFGLAHLTYGSLIEALGAFILGLVLAWNFKKNDSLYPNIIGHFFYNMIALAFLFII